MNPIRSFREFIRNYEEWERYRVQEDRVYAFLLYASADANVGRYVRNHFDWLNRTSGRHCLIFVADRDKPSHWHEDLLRDPRAYWIKAGGLENSWWEDTIPYDEDDVKFVAKNFGMNSGSIPCFVFFKTPRSNEIIIYRLEDEWDDSQMNAEMRALFGTIDKAAEDYLEGHPGDTRPEEMQQAIWESLEKFVKERGAFPVRMMVIGLALNVIQILEIINRTLL